MSQEKGEDVTAAAGVVVSSNDDDNDVVALKKTVRGFAVGVVRQLRRRGCGLGRITCEDNVRE